MKLDHFRKRFTSLLSVALLSALALPAAAAEIQDRNFKVAIAVNAGTAHYDGGVKFCELLDKKSGGKMKAKMYGGGALGKDTAVVSSMQGGIIDMAVELLTDNPAYALTADELASAAAAGRKAVAKRPAQAAAHANP